MSSRKFNEYKGLDLPQLGREVLEVWDRENTFGRSITEREGAPAFIFYEGPPSANGLPGIHHVLSRTIKDTICRYKTQQGYLVRRKAGWDTHGLPVELGVEKKLGITKEDIGHKISIEEYNRTCREAVMEFTGVWEELTRKMGYWVDMKHPYITYENKYIETLWWMLKQLFDKGLLYKGYTIQPYSPAAGTGLSNHELNQPGCYRDVKDTTCTAQFEIIRDERSEFLFDDAQGTLYFLAWTTTPWTLPSNTALAVGDNIEMPQSLHAAAPDGHSRQRTASSLFHSEDGGNVQHRGTDLQGFGTGRNTLPAAYRLGEADGRCLPRHLRRLRDHGGRYGHRAHRPHLRRRRRPRR